MTLKYINIYNHPDVGDKLRNNRTETTSYRPQSDPRIVNLQRHLEELFRRPDRSFRDNKHSISKQK